MDDHTPTNTLLFKTNDKVIFFDDNLKLWKKGEIVCYVEPEYKVSYGGNWNWVDQNKLSKDNIHEMNSIETKEDNYNITEQLTAVIHAVNWSCFSNFFSEYLLGKIWKSIATKGSEYINIETDLNEILHQLILIFFSKFGLMNDKISQNITKPFVLMLKKSILKNIKNDNKQILFEEFKRFSVWIPRSLKQIFQNGLKLNINDLNTYMNRELLSEVWNKCTKQNAYELEKTQLQLKNLIPIIHEIIIRYCKHSLGIDENILYETTIIKPYVYKMVNILKQKLYKDSMDSYISKEQFINFNFKIVSSNKLQENLKKYDCLVIDLNELKTYLSKKILRQIWKQFDKNNETRIEIKQLRLLLHYIIENYALFMDLQHYIDVESVSPLVNILYFVITTRLNKSVNDKYLTHDEFIQFGKIINDLKLDALKAQSIDKLNEYVQKHILEEVWDEYQTRECDELQTYLIQPMIQNIVDRFTCYSLSEANENLSKQKRIPFHTPTQIFQFGVSQCVLKIILPCIINGLDPQKIGTVSKERFMHLKQWLPNWNNYNRLDILNINELENVMTKQTLNQIWDEIDKDNENTITHKELKQILNTIFQDFIINNCNAYLLTKNKQKVQLLSNKLSTIITQKFDRNIKINCEQFLQLGNIINEIKMDALNFVSVFIDWKDFEKYIFDKDKEMNTQNMNELYTKLVCKYCENLFKTNYDSNKFPFNDINDLQIFGIIQIVSSILDTYCIKTKDFMELPSKYISPRESIQKTINSETVSNILDTSVLNAIWSRYDDGNGIICISQLWSVLRQLFKNYFAKLNDFNDLTVEQYVNDLVNTIGEQIYNELKYESKCQSLSKDEFISIISQFNENKILKQFVDINVIPLQNKLINILEMSQLTYLSLLDIQKLLQSTFNECVSFITKTKNELNDKNVNVEELKRSIIGLITSEFINIFCTYFNDNMFMDDEISKKIIIDTFNKNNDEIINQLQLKLNTVLECELYLSLLLIDKMDNISQHNIDILWHKFDPNNSNYINKCDLEMLLLELIKTYLENKGEKTITKNKKQIDNVVQLLMTNIFEYIDEDNVYKLSRSQLDEFLLWLNNLKRIDLNYINIAWNIYEKVPNVSIIRSIVNHIHLMLPGMVCKQVELILIESQKIIEEIQQQNTDEKYDDINTEMHNKITEISQRHLVLAVVEQFKDKELIDLLNVNDDGEYNGLMNEIINDIQKDIIDEIKNENITNYINTHIHIKDCDILKIIYGLTPSVIDNIESIIIAKSINRIAINVAKMTMMDEIIIHRLTELLQNEKNTIKFSDKFKDIIQCKLNRNKVSLYELFNLLTDSNSDEKLFVIIIESLEECLLFGMNEYFANNNELSDNLAIMVKQRANNSFCDEISVDCNAILWSILWRIIGIVLILIAILWLIISIILTIFGILLLSLSMLRFTFAQKFVIFYYMSIVLCIFWFNVFKLGLVMIVMPSAALLGFAAFIYKLAFTNLYVSKILKWINEKQNNEFNLNKWIKNVINFIIDILLVVVYKIDATGSLKEKLFAIHSNENSFISKFVKQQSNKPPKNYQKLSINNHSVLRMRSSMHENEEQHVRITFNDTNVNGRTNTNDGY